MGIYRRAPIEVLAIDGERLAAFTYQSTTPLDPSRKPSVRYIGLLVGGARHHGLPEEYVKYLESFELAHDERVARPVVPG